MALALVLRMRQGCLVQRRVHAVTLVDQRVELLQDVGAILVTLRVPLADQRQLPVPGVISVGEQPALSRDTTAGLLTTIDSALRCDCFAAVIRWPYCRSF